MMRNVRWIALIMACLQASAPAWALQFPVVGARAQAMGGAGVAMGDPAVALYWNPAALGLPQNFALQIPAAAVGVDVTNNMLKKVKDIAGLATIAGKANGAKLNLGDMGQLFDALKSLKDLERPGSGMIASVQSGLYLRVTSIAVGALVTGDAGVSVTKVDLDNLRLENQKLNFDLPTSGPVGGHPVSDVASPEEQAAVADAVGTVKQAGVNSNVSNDVLANEILFQAKQGGMSNEDIKKNIASLKEANPVVKTVLTSSGPIANNGSEVSASGLAMAEVAVGHGRKFPWVSDRFEMLQDLYLGLAVKAIQGASVRYSVQANKAEFDPEKLLRQVEDVAGASPKFTADAGLLWITPLPVRTQVGLVARNITSPTFTPSAKALAAGATPVTVKPQVRAGVMVNPFWGFLKLATDIDVTKNETFMPGLDSRMFGAGAEFSLWIAALRAGIMKNLADSTADWIYTAGVSIGPPVIYAEISAAAGGGRANASQLLDTTLPLPGYGKGDIPSSVRVQASIGMHF